MTAMENNQSNEQAYLDSNGLLLWEDARASDTISVEDQESVLLTDDTEWLEEELAAMNNAQKKG